MPGHRAVGIGFVFIIIIPSIVLARTLRIILRVPPQRRVAMASGNVPDFDGAVVAAASDQFAVRRKSYGVDPVIETSQHMKHTGT